MSNFTPGPWRVSENHHNILSDHSPHRDGRPRLLAAVYHVEPMGVWDHTETHANARLMAAAPELFEKLVELTDIHDVCFCEDTQSQNQGDCVWCEARAIIRRIEGEEA